MSRAKAQTADTQHDNSDEANPYQRFFWLIVAVAFTLIGSGVYAAFSKATTDAGNYATLSADLRNLVGKVDALTQKVDSASKNEAVLNLIARCDAKIEMLQNQVGDLKEFKAATEARGVKP